MIDCVICLESMKPPIKVLSCGHSFCSRCIREMSRQNQITNSKYCNILTCPTCRRETVVPKGRTSKLPNNYALQDVLALHNKNSCASVAVEENLDENDASNTSDSHCSFIETFSFGVNDEATDFGYADFWDDFETFDDLDDDDEFDGNWFCPNEMCCYYNFSFRTVCRWCHTPREITNTEYQQQIIDNSSFVTSNFFYQESVNEIDEDQFMQS